MVVAGPLPDANPFRAMRHGGVHVQPLRKGVFAGHHDVDVVSAAQTVIKDREQAIGIRRQINAHNIGLLVDDMVEETGILVGKAIVILLPDMRGEQIIQRRYRPAPR